MATVLLTDPIDPEIAVRLREHATIAQLGSNDSSELLHAASRAEVIIVRRQIPAEILERSPALRALVRHGAGLDFIPVADASRLAIAVTNVPSVNANSVAEHVVGLMISLARRLGFNDRGIRSGQWESLRVLGPTGVELRGRVVGLVGYGHIGQRVAEICHVGFGMRVKATRRRPLAPGPVESVDLDTLLQTSDFIVVACPLTAETKGMIGPRELDLVRDSAFLINVARGAIVDEAGLTERLAAGRIAGAGIDVFACQPLPSDHPLTRLDNVMLTPHVAGITKDSMRAMSAVAVDDTIRVLQGQRPQHLVNEDAWPAIASRWRRLARESDRDEH